ncbi:MAG: TatD family hydrolase [Acetobacter sp.]|nr:TatD family hydrolase [Bacteroides sp.]MCM1341481.1 TatD family hydrolase [Acetobacter sp.]MCM1434174.1 TatD family hydrolase [Clostridiales bacterium]
MYHNIFDTHSHYDDEKFNPDREELFNSLQSQGISYVVSCGCDIASTQFNFDLAQKYDFLYFASGFHPENLEDASFEDLDIIKKFAENEKCVAIGEIGLDYHWMSSTKKVQKDFFEAQIQLAKEIDLPVIVHDREAHQDTLDILKATKPKGVVHCFSGSKEMAKEIIKLGMYIGLNGVVTFNNARKSLEVAKEIPIDRLVLETDCPYLAPVPMRGKRNNSAYIQYTAEKIAQLLDMDTQKLLDITNENAKRLYNIK